MYIATLGPFKVRTDDDVVIDLPGARVRGLLVALALHTGHVVPKATLIDWIWGENPPADAANALQRLVSRLRKTLPEGVVEGHTGGYRLTLPPDAVDALRFDHLVSEARHDEGLRRVRLLREALAIWRGAAMQDVEVQDSATFDAAVTRLEALRLTALEDHYEADTQIGRTEELIPELTELVASHPLRERLAASLMRALAAAGRDSEAIQVYQRASDALAEELGVDPSPELSSLHVSLLRGELAAEDHHQKTNLRAEMTSYVGKNAEVKAVRDLITKHRLVTLTGPGGAGKTRMSTETARTLLPGFRDGVWLVELGKATAEADLAQATIAALGMRDAPAGSASYADQTGQLIAALRGRDTLLVVDNCEHVIDSVAAFADRLLRECGQLRILATSREPLGITGEALWPVEPLALPEENAAPVAIEEAAAVRLLRDRAEAARPDFTVDEPTLSTMARVCRSLDGMPLAIELAAARLRTMSLDQLAARLHDRLGVLTVGSRTAQPRHQTLRAVIDWSWDLLTDAERAVLRRLAVFSGGASLEAAEEVCASGSVASNHVFELLTSLAEKSLLRVNGTDVPRYHVNGVLQEYATERLAEAEETELARTAHLTYLTELAEMAEPQLRGSDQLAWLEALGNEHDNIAAAMRGALAAGDAAAAMWLAANCSWYWWLSGHKAEGLDMIISATELPGEVRDDVRAWVYSMAVMFATARLGDERQAAQWIHQAHRSIERAQSSHRLSPILALVRPLEQMLRSPAEYDVAFEPLLEHEDAWVRALSRLQLGKARITTGRGDEADAYLEKALAEYRSIGDRFGIAFAHTELADQLAARGDFAAACDHYEQAVVVSTEMGAIDEVIRLRSRQAQLFYLLGDVASSADADAAAEQCAQRVTWPHSLAELTLARAEIARWEGNREEAHRQLDLVTSLLGEAETEQPHFRTAIHDILGYLTDDLSEARHHREVACAAAHEARYAPLIARAIVGVADYALHRERFELAARLLAASAAARGLAERSQPDGLRIEQALRGRLGDERFDEVMAAPAEIPWPDLVRDTLAS